MNISDQPFVSLLGIKTGMKVVFLYIASVLICNSCLFFVPPPLPSPPFSGDRLAEIEAFVLNTMEANQFDMEIHTPPSPSGDTESLSRQEGTTTSTTPLSPPPHPTVNISKHTAYEESAHAIDMSSPPRGVPEGQTEHSMATHRREMVMLRRVSTMTGLSPNKLLHELMVDATYQLPLSPVTFPTLEVVGMADEPLTASQMSSLVQADPSSAATALKKHMLRIMGDRMIASMQLSPYDIPLEVKDRYMDGMA